jgi:hypothetical protein
MKCCEYNPLALPANIRLLGANTPAYFGNMSATKKKLLQHRPDEEKFENSITEILLPR